MTPRRLLPLAVVGLTCVAPLRSGAQQAPGDTTAAAKIEAAATAAGRWLALVDAAHYRASWDSAATMFRQQITPAGWQEAVIAARRQVDPLGARRRTSVQHTLDLPNAPPGEYVVLRFTTAAREDTRVTETVVLTLDRDNAWRVAGYFIKPA